MKLIIGGITTTPYDHTAHWVIYHRLSLQKEQRKLLDLIKDVVLRWGKGQFDGKRIWVEKNLAQI